MPLDDDDNPFLTPPPPPTSRNGTAGAGGADADADDDGEEGPLDMKVFNSMFKKKGITGQSIRKGQKDFESHGTKAQDNALEASRRAIDEVLQFTRVHKADRAKGWYFPDYWPAALEEMEKGTPDEPPRPEFVQAIDPSIHVRDCVVVMEDTKGTLFKSIGRSVRGLKYPRPAIGKAWLLPEEALFLVERGSLDMWWPDWDLDKIMPTTKPVLASPEDAVAAPNTGVPPTDADREEDGEDTDDTDDEFANGVPLSLQAAYAFFIGLEGERGKITLPKFQVYTHLKRLGYYVLRAPPVSSQPTDAASSNPPTSLWQWLFSLLRQRPEPAQLPPFGPLVRPGLYRSYNPIFKQLEMIPRFKPTAEPQDATGPEDPYKVFFHVWKPSGTTFSKSNPPPPDFRIAVADARDTFIPTLEEITALLNSTPSAPPDPSLAGPMKMYQRLKHGHRNVLVAVVDRGIVNFMRFGEAAFGDETIYERFDSRGQSNSGGKKGGRGGGRGGRGGRGRGRGRGGRGRGRGG